MMKKIYCLMIFSFWFLQYNFAQDPHFSQFFMAPQFMNPAIVGTSPSDWLLMSNLRQQWGNAGTPFNTQTLAGEIRIKTKEESENTLGAGLAFMSDQSMNGSFRSVYFSGSLAYHASLNENDKLGIGFQANYGNRKIDYSQLVFGEQFTSGGFDVTFPTGETAISNMKPFFSLGAGLLYNHKFDNLNFDLGIAAFHINKPRQTFLADGNEILPLRIAAHFNVEYKLSDLWVLNFNSCYQRQAKPSYFSVGGTVGKDVSEGDFENILYFGGWFREGDSFYPYVGWLKGNVQIGFTYDITHSKQNQGPYIPKSFETSIVIKQKHTKPGVIPCPWR
jgi:type IX secretion system PorP/SprF family membrane protein